MAKFTGRDLHQTLKDLEGKTIKDYARPDQEVIDAEVAAGRQPKLVEIIVTPHYMIKTALRRDLSEQTPQGRAPDPHESKKMELFELLVKVVDTKVDSEELILESESITIIKSRCEKIFPVEWYGRLVQVLERGKTAEEKDGSEEARGNGREKPQKMQPAR